MHPPSTYVQAFSMCPDATKHHIAPASCFQPSCTSRGWFQYMPAMPAIHYYIGPNAFTRHSGSAFHMVPANSSPIVH